MSESVEYRWLLFDRKRKEAYFDPDYDLDSIRTITCWGLYCFPPKTLFPVYCLNSDKPESAVRCANHWAEKEAIPLRKAMSRNDWEQLVRLTAYYAWEREGRRDGHDVEDWENAAGQLADLLKTEYVFVKFEQPEVVPDGTDEADQHSTEPEQHAHEPVSGGSGGGEGSAPTSGKKRGILRGLADIGKKFLEGSSAPYRIGPTNDRAPYRIYSRDGQGTGGVVKQATPEESGQET